MIHDWEPTPRSPKREPEREENIAAGFWLRLRVVSGIGSGKAVAFADHCWRRAMLVTPPMRPACCLKGRQERRRGRTH